MENGTYMFLISSDIIWTLRVVWGNQPLRLTQHFNWIDLNLQKYVVIRGDKKLLCKPALTFPQYSSKQPSIYTTLTFSNHHFNQFWVLQVTFKIFSGKNWFLAPILLFLNRPIHWQSFGFLKFEAPQAGLSSVPPLRGITSITKFKFLFH